jgi:hypothetical protein
MQVDWALVSSHGRLTVWLASLLQQICPPLLGVWASLVQDIHGQDQEAASTSAVKPIAHYSYYPGSILR